MEIPKHHTLIERVRWLAAQKVLHLPAGSYPSDGRFYRNGYPQWMKDLVEQARNQKRSKLNKGE